VANESSKKVSIVLGPGIGSFGAATNFTVAGIKPRSVAVGDHTEDGIQDLAAPNQNSASLSVLLGTGTGSFGAATNFTVGTSPFSVAVGGFNGGGEPDLAGVNKATNNVLVLLNTTSFPRPLSFNPLSATQRNP